MQTPFRTAIVRKAITPIHHNPILHQTKRPTRYPFHNTIIPTIVPTTITIPPLSSTQLLQRHKQLNVRTIKLDGGLKQQRQQPQQLSHQPTNPLTKFTLPYQTPLITTIVSHIPMIPSWLAKRNSNEGSLAELDDNIKRLHTSNNNTLPNNNTNTSFTSQSNTNFNNTTNKDGYHDDNDDYDDDLFDGVVETTAEPILINQLSDISEDPLDNNYGPSIYTQDDEDQGLNIDDIDEEGNKQILQALEDSPPSAPPTAKVVYNDDQWECEPGTMKPLEPDANLCCGNDCHNCVWIQYDDQMSKWKTAEMKKKLDAQKAAEVTK